MITRLCIFHNLMYLFCHLHFFIVYLGGKSNLRSNTFILLKNAMTKKVFHCEKYLTRFDWYTVCLHLVKKSSLLICSFAIFEWCELNELGIVEEFKLGLPTLEQVFMKF